MITVEIGKKKLKITGHAGCGKSGNDIVCAAVSSLWYTAIGKMMEEKVRFEDKEEIGKCELQILEDSEVAGAILDVIRCGLEMIQMNYPKKISLKKC